VTQKLLYIIKRADRIIDSVVEEEFEDTKGVIRIRKWKTDNTMAKRKSTKWQTLIYKTYT